MADITFDNLFEERKKCARLRAILEKIHSISNSGITYSVNSKDMLESLKLIQNQLDLR